MDLTVGPTIDRTIGLTIDVTIDPYIDPLIDITLHLCICREWERENKTTMINTEQRMRG